VRNNIRARNAWRIFARRGFVVVEDIPERFNFEPEDGPYESMYCEMCRQAHIVNVRTGKVLGADDDDVEATNSG